MPDQMQDSTNVNLLVSHSESELTLEQKSRIEENKKKALELKRKRYENRTEHIRLVVVSGN